MYQIPNSDGQPAEPRRPGRPREDLESQSWDGVIRHKKKAGVTGFKRHGCRCPVCLEAAVELRARSRKRDKEHRERGLQEGNFKHGITGYRQYGCRCEVCNPAGLAFNRANQGSYSRPSRKPKVDSTDPEEPTVDWDSVAHLRPGWTVEQRKD